MTGSPATGAVCRHDVSAARADIPAAAPTEFAAHGHAGARVDRIAARSGMSKPMISSHFGDKDGLYAAAPCGADVQKREGERMLNLTDLDPVETIRTLVGFPMDHFVAKP